MHDVGLFLYWPSVVKLVLLFFFFFISFGGRCKGECQESSIQYLISDLQSTFYITTLDTTTIRYYDNWSGTIVLSKEATVYQISYKNIVFNTSWLPYGWDNC